MSIQSLLIHSVVYRVILIYINQTGHILNNNNEYNEWQKNRVSREMTDLWKLYKLTNKTMSHSMYSVKFTHRCQYPKTGWRVKVHKCLALILKQQEFALIISDTKFITTIYKKTWFRLSITTLKWRGKLYSFKELYIYQYKHFHMCILPILKFTKINSDH